LARFLLNKIFVCSQVKQEISILLGISLHSSQCCMKATFNRSGRARKAGLALKLENAKADERFWSNLHAMHVGTVEDHKGLVAAAERKIVEGQAGMALAALPSRSHLNASCVTLAGAHATLSAVSRWLDCRPPSSRQ
jgi:hypothetical protein